MNGNTVLLDSRGLKKVLFFFTLKNVAFVNFCDTQGFFWCVKY